MKKTIAVTKKIDHAHKHDHCKHEHLKFCAQCNRPHCLDCGAEWNYYTVYGALSGSTYTGTGTNAIYQNQQNTANQNQAFGVGKSALGGSAIGSTNLGNTAKVHTH